MKAGFSRGFRSFEKEKLENEINAGKKFRSRRIFFTCIFIDHDDAINEIPKLLEISPERFLRGSRADPSNKQFRAYFVKTKLYCFQELISQSSASVALS